MNITEKRTNIILESLFDGERIMDIVHQYGEPGYDDPEKSILLGNWNNVSNALAEYLEEAGYSLEWYDEWIVDHEYGKAYRSSADSYHWQASFHITEDGGMLTPDDDVIDWIEEMELTDYNQPMGALPGWIPESEILENGYTRINLESYENGWHCGQNDEPDKIAESLFNKGYRKVVFQINETSQFYIKFDVYAKEDDAE